MVNQYRAAFNTRHNTLFTQNYLRQIIVIAYTGKNNICNSSSLSGSLGQLATVLAEPTLSNFCGAIIDCHPVAIGAEPTRHGIAHNTQTNKCDANGAHYFPSSL
jgi:hypothetical protein